MKVSVLPLAILSLLTSSSICFPFYVIELESGSEVVVDSHWKNNGKIAFYFHGGVVAIPMHLVRNIRESDRPPAQEDAFLRHAGKTQQADEESAIIPGKTAKGPANNSIGEVKVDFMANGKHEETRYEDFKDQRLLLKSEMKEATKRFREASGSKDLQAKQEAIQDITAISKKLHGLAKELKAKNKGVLPDWWE
ncbi:MAG: hypothetical protein SWH78_00760 [Thermodesulfobacteriota bacterium]|nr:hypothetical protein [Thermodesulfobacteriota bacterium]